MPNLKPLEDRTLDGIFNACGGPLDTTIAAGKSRQALTYWRNKLGIPEVYWDTLAKRAADHTGTLITTDDFHHVNKAVWTAHN